MFIHIDFPVFFTFASFLLFFILTVYAFRFRRALGGIYLLTTLFLSSLLSFSSVFELLSETIQSKIFWRNVQQIPLFLTSLALYGGVLALTGKNKKVINKRLTLLGIPIIVYLLLIFTDPYHHLMRESVSLSSFGEQTRLSIKSTLLSISLISYSKIIGLLLIFTLIRSLKTVSTFNQRQIYIILCAVIIPFVLALLKKFIGLNLSASTSAIPGGLLIFYSIIQHKFLSVSPIAKDKIIENLSEGIIVVNQHDLILEVNPAAKDILRNVVSQTTENFIGKDINVALQNNMEVVDFITEESTGRREIELNERHYSLNVIPVEITNGVTYKLLILSDLTDRILYEKHLYNRATVDYLTKVFNRQYINDIAPGIINELNATKSNISLIVLDIDFFKKVNDTFGHQSGDRVLEKLGRVLIDRVHGRGIVARMGGEEFAILLTDVSEEYAFQLAEDIRMHIENLKIYIKEDTWVSVTVSLGLKSISDSKVTFSELYREADKALYLSKENGRNQTTISKQYVTT